MRTSYKIRLILAVLGFAVFLALLPASTSAQSTISFAPNPCANDTAEPIPVWTLSGNTCISLATYQSLPAGSWNIACPNGGVFQAVWLCNTGPRPQFSMQYSQCLFAGGANIGTCDPLGLGQDIVGSLVDWEGDISFVAAIAAIALNHQPGIQTICNAAAVTGLSKNALIALLGVAIDTACSLTESYTPPTVTAQAQYVGFTISINGYMAPTTVGATMRPALACFGDSSPCVKSYFPMLHSYTARGNYLATVTAIDSNGLTATIDLNISIQAATGTPPTIQLFPCAVDGLSATCNGVAQPTGNASITQIEWCFSDGTTCFLNWFPVTHRLPPSGGTFNVVATATDSNGHSASAHQQVVIVRQSSPPNLTSIIVTPSSTINPGETVTLGFSLSGPAPTGGAVINLASSAPIVFPLPSSVVISAGSSSISITATLAPNSGAGSAVVTASYGANTIQTKLFFE